MKLSGKSTNQEKIDIRDYYAINPGALWAGLKQEGAAFWWLCIYFFFEYVRPQSLYPAIDILPWAQLALIIACVAAFTDRRVTWVTNSGHALLGLFIFIVILSGVFAFRPSVSFGNIDILLGWVVLYGLIITVVNTEKRFFIFLLLFFLVNFKMSQYGFRTFLTSGYSSWGVSGAPGWFRDSGDLGIQMTIFVTLATGFILALRSYWGKYKRLLFYMMPLTGLVTILATSSRGAQLGIIAAGAWFLFISRRIKVIFGILIIGWAIYMILPPQMIGEFEDAGEDDTSLTRLALWRYGMDVVSDYPALGVGYYNWLDYCWYMNPNGVEGEIPMSGGAQYLRYYDR